MEMLPRYKVVLKTISNELSEYPYCIPNGSGGYLCFKTGAEAAKREGDFIEVSSLPDGCLEYPV